MMDSFGSWGHGFGLMWLVPLLVLVVVVALLRNVFTGDRAESSGNDVRPESARETLDRRYASGEISTEEYEAKKRALKR